MRKLLLLLILIATPLYAEEGVEVISGFDTEKDLPVVNNEIRKLDDRGQNLDGRVNTLEDIYAADSASNDTYVISLGTAPTAYTTGMAVYFKATTANTGACTLNVNGLGAKSLKSLHDQDPADNYIEAGSIVHVLYDGSLFQILNP